jgi:ubiquinone/menaquinone biosynthesis C-methylase UbiE
LEIYFEIFNEIPRLGPGNANSTLKAFNLVKNGYEKPLILDIGSGVGKHIIDILRDNMGKVIALDFHKPYLMTFKLNAMELDLRDSIDLINSSMLFLNFKEESFDIIWSEGAIYIAGFEKGLKNWKKFLKKGGYLVISELTWFKSPPDELKEYFDNEYPPMKFNSQNLDIIENLGYKIIDNFPIPESSWMNDFYIPLQKRVNFLREKNQDNDEFIRVLETIQHEIDIYKRYSEYYGYYFYVLQNK